jgi:hypothetical protein
MAVTGVCLVLLQGSAGGIARETLAPGFWSSTPWHMPRRAFGGFSALELGDDGHSFMAVSDRGTSVEGRLERDASGRITQILSGRIRPLLDEDGLPLPPVWNDSEGLARAADGSVYVSFEREARVLHYARPGAPAKALPRPAAFFDFPRNAAFEGLAIAPDGTVLAIPEDRSGEGFVLWRFDGVTWASGPILPRLGTFLPVGADFGPDGRLYVLERAFHGLAGFASQIRSFSYSAGGLSDQRILLQTDPGVHDNLEGLSVWRDAEGAIRLTMVSDDNFLWLQQTQIVEYRLDD